MFCSSLVPLHVSAIIILSDTKILSLHPVSSANQAPVVNKLPPVRGKPNRREPTPSQLHPYLVASSIEFVANASWVISSWTIFEDVLFFVDEVASLKVAAFAHIVSLAPMDCGRLR
jgi:hypothetical protein